MTEQRLTALIAALEQDWPALPTHDSQPAFVSKPDGCYTLGELLRFHDYEFVANAYQAILLRPADLGGLHHYLDRLRQGERKVAILGQLRYSPEGRQQRVTIKGLWRSFLLWRVYNLPIVGRLLQTLAILMRLPTIEHNIHHFEAYAMQQMRQSALRISEEATTIQHGQQRWMALRAALPMLQQTLTELAQDKADTEALRDLSRTFGQDTQQSLAKITEHLHDLEKRYPAHALQHLAEQVRELRESKADSATLNALADKWQDVEQQLRSEISAQAHLLHEHKADATELTRWTDHFTEMVRTKVDQSALAELHGSFAQTIQAKADQASLMGLIGEVRELQQRIQEHKRTLLDQQRRLGLLLEEARKRLPAPLETVQLLALANETDHLLDAMYASFEDRFRGDRAEIKQRLTVYLPMVEAVQADIPNAPILDLGCGRGEWLELLKERDLTACGVDLNRIMIGECRERGFEVVEADALEHLRKLPDNSLGAITGMHIIEHLPLPILIALLDESLRVLRPSGLIVFETPNPENLVVGACNFYMDPTHRNPLPPAMVEYLVEARGYVRVEIRRWQQGLQDPLQLLQSETPGATELNPLIQLTKGYYFGPPDYAVIGYKA
ncbi:MAG: methyltransferase domain-containing protein [Candidatus Competibacteraceae bacterium]|nr:methyltransferase domain-containing protein [Candidatus Competibacteraceae bacterium]